MGLVDYVAVDIKNCWEKYGETVGVPDIDVSPVKKTVELLSLNKVDYEFRTTVVKRFHTKDDISRLCAAIKGAPRYFLQNFVNSGDLIDGTCEGVKKAEMYEMLEKAREYIPTAEVRGL